jgi:hypothetical protein
MSSGGIHLYRKIFPDVIISIMAAEWSEEAFLKRVHRRVAELGKAESALLREAGLDDSLIRKVPGRARRMDSIASIARALDWTLAEAIGVQSTSRVDVELLGRALLVAERKIPRRLADRGRAVSQAAALFYDILAERKEDGQPVPDDAEALALADALIRGMGFSPTRG